MSTTFLASLRASLLAEGFDPSILSDQATAWLVKNQGLLPLVLDDVRLGTDNFDWEEESQDGQQAFDELKEAHQVPVVSRPELITYAFKGEIPLKNYKASEKPALVIKKTIFLEVSPETASYAWMNSFRAFWIMTETQNARSIARLSIDISLIRDARERLSEERLLKIAITDFLEGTSWYDDAKTFGRWESSVK